MARKKSDTPKQDAAAPKAKAKKGGTKKKAGVSTETAAKSGTPKKGTKKASAGTGGGGGGGGGGAAVKKKAAPVKLNDRQRDFLKKIKDAGEGGYFPAQKVEERTLTALVERKLVKQGAKDKEKKSRPYLLSKAGEKHLVGVESNASAGSSAS